MSLIVGLGSPHGDDQLGWLAIDRLRSRLPSGVVAQRARHGVELLEHLEGHDSAIVIDTAMPTGNPGAIRLFDWPSPELAGSTLWSTHGLGLIDALRLAEALGRLPRLVRIYTIEAMDTSPGISLSPNVARQLDALLERILVDSASLGRPC